MLEELSNQFKNSTILVGIAIILMNIGGSHISKEIPDYIQEIFNKPLLRRFLIFVIVFIYTKDVKTAVIVTLLFVIFFTFLLNKNSRYCILSENITLKDDNVKNKDLYNALNIINMHLTKNN